MTKKYVDTFYKPVNLIDYKVLKHLQTWLFPCSCFLLLSGVRAENVLLMSLSAFSIYLDFYLSKPYAVYYVKNLKELNVLYKSFLANYHNLNQTFDLKNPLDIMLLYTHLLNDGFLSKSKSLEQKKVLVEHNVLQQFQIFTGEATCRHIAKTLKDILNGEDIKSSVLINYVTSSRIDGEVLEDISILKREIDKLSLGKLYEVSELEDIFLIVEDLRSKGLLPDSYFSLKDSSLFGNHEITLASYEGRNYYLDSTNNIIFYRRKIDGKTVLTNGFMALVPITSFYERKFYKLELEKISRVRKFLQGAQATLAEELEARKRVNEIYQGNQDIFERFYLDNKAIYEDISYHLERTRSNMKIKSRFLI